MFSAIVDTDPGVDDIVALVYAEITGLPILGITTVHGNSNITNVTNNARFIAQYISGKPQVYKGSSVSLDGNQYYAESSGENGLGNYSYTNKHPDNEPDTDAVEFIRATLNNAKEEKIDLLCLGPLTNIAIVLNLHPEICSKINRIVAMLGVFNEKGNITPYAEFNSYCDPDAAQSVVRIAEENNVDMYIIPADVCRKVQITSQELKIIDESLSIPHLRDIMEPYLQYYLTNPKYGGFKGAVMYDLLVSVFVEDPSLFTYSPAKIDVHTDPDKHHGQTTASLGSVDSTVYLCTDVNAAEVKKLFLRKLSEYKKSKTT